MSANELASIGKNCSLLNLYWKGVAEGIVAFDKLFPQLLGAFVAIERGLDELFVVKSANEGHGHGMASVFVCFGQALFAERLIGDAGFGESDQD
jgi:hypothetical protein